MLHFNNCLPRPLQTTVPGALGGQQVTLTRTDGVAGGDSGLCLPCCPSITLSDLPTAWWDILWTDLPEHKAVPPLVLSTDLKLGTLPPT